jgi:HK97 family phage major capsid protein
MNQSNIWALRQRGIELVGKLEKLNALADAEHRNLTAAEQTDWNATKILISKNNVSIAEAEAVLDAERNGGRGVEVRGDGTFGPHSSSSGRTKPQIGAKYAQLFGIQHELSRDGFNSMDEFLSTWHSGLADNRLRSALRVDSGMQAAGSEQREVSPSLGGMMVPSEFAQNILDVALESEIVRPRATVWPMATNSRKIPGVDGFSHANQQLLGGITSAFVGETDTLGLQNIKLWLLEMVCKKMGLLIQASNELIADSDFESVLGPLLISACQWEMDYAFLWGNGAGVPRGVFNDPALIAVAKDSGQLAATTTYNNICNMFARLYPAGRKKAVWVATSDCLPQLLQLALLFKNEAGTDYVGGSSVPIFTKGADGGWELLGRPLILSEKLQALGTQGDILLADFSQYAIGMRRELTLERSMHAGFTTDSLYLRMICRCDGVGTWKTALTPPNSENSLSPFVTLATRS